MSIEVIKREKAHFKIEIKDVSHKPIKSRTISLSNHSEATVDSLKKELEGYFLTRKKGRS